jgi:hypothetical protein
MSFQRTIRIVLIFAPLLLFPLVLALPHYSARLSLILNGHPFARVVPKEKLDVSQYVQFDDFGFKSVVFSSGKAVGLIDQPFLNLAHFESFPIQENSVDVGFPMWFYALLCIAWFLRWWLLPIQAILLLLWLRQREENPVL